MYKFFLLLCIYILISIFSFAAKISGTIKDADDNKALQGVLIVVKELNKVTESDSNGYYEINDVESGTYEVMFSFVTYKQLLQTVSVLNNKDVLLDISMKGESNTLKDVTVRSNRITNTENAVMMEIRKSNLTVSGISAAQISKTADRNAADVVRRLPGVSIFDDRFLVVRGLHDRYNTVWLNDAGAPSSEVDKKSFSFDLIPSGVLDRMMLYKTPAPELPGDFAGGMVKIYTSSLPERNQIDVGLQTSYRANTTGKEFYYNTPSTTDWLGYDDGKRGMPENTPEYINKNDSTNGALTKSFGKNDWLIKQRMASPDIRFNLKAANVIRINKVKLGNTFAVSYSNLLEGYAVKRQNQDSAGIPFYSTTDSRYANEVNVTAMDNLVAVFGNSKIEFKNLYNQVGTSTLLQRNSNIDTLPGERGYIMEFSSRAVYTSQLSGTHKTSSGKTRYNWTLGYTDLFKNLPDLRRINYNKQPGDDDSMYRAPIANVVDPVNGGGRYFAELYEHVYSFNHNFSQDVRIKNYGFEVSAGNFIEYKSRAFNSRVLGYTIRPGKNANTLTHLPIDEIFADSNTGENNKFRIDEITSRSDKYAAQNQLIASYIALKLPYKNRLNIYGGLRYEHNTQKLQSFVNQDSISPDIVTKFWLPSVNVSYNINEKMLLRVAYGKTLNRPEFREWAPLFFYDMEERWGVYGSLFEHRLQDTLKVTQIQNYDVRWEWYPSNEEMVHVGFFYKKFRDPIQFYILSPGSDSRQMTYINTREAYSAGVEVDVRKKLTFADELLNINFFKSLSLMGNITLLKSEMKIDDTIGNVTSATMQGQSPYMMNGGLFYQNEENGFQGSLLYNVYGPRMIALGSQRVPDIGELPFQSFDAYISKRFFRHYTLTLGIQNILGSTYIRIQDQNLDGKYDKTGTADSPYRSYAPGRYYSVGVKVKF